MKKTTISITAILLLSMSCVSKKKYVALETQYTDIKANLQKTTLAKEDLQSKFTKIENRVTQYNEKINSLKGDNISLKKENYIKLDRVENSLVISKKNLETMRETLLKVTPAVLAKAKNLKDSLNLAISYNLKNKVR